MIRNLLFIGVIFCLSVAIFYTTMNKLDPLGEQSVIAFSSFFISVFFGISSFFTLFFFFMKELFSGKKQGHKVFLISLRRGILIAIFITTIFALQLLRLVGNFEISLLALFLILVELIFVSSKKNLSDVSEN